MRNIRVKFERPYWPQIRLCEFKISANFNKRDFKISEGAFC